MTALAPTRTSPVYLTDAPELKPDALVLSPAEQAWVRNQQRKQTGQTSKYVPHQGAKERAKRLKRLAERG